MKAGEQYGQWELIEAIGGGGNGDVWRCRRDGYDDSAIKFLREFRNRERLGRFQNEIGFLLTGGKRPGIVPIIDHDLNGPKFVWYTMPLATPLRNALGPDPQVETVLKAVAEIVATLTELASERISHRDIKPDNLFLYDNRAAVGDFGLVKYPSGQALTRHGRKLGPTDFMAPEMREDPDTADGELADVYSIAKTLWTLLTGSNIPLPGQHRADDDICRLTNRIMSRHTPYLDLLIERCTSNDPRKRLRMAEVRGELHAILSPFDSGGLTLSDTNDVEKRVAALAERHSRNDAARQKFNEQCGGAWRQLTEEVAKPAYWDIARRLPSFSTRHPVQIVPPRSLTLIPSVWDGTDGWAGSIVSPGNAGVRVDAGFAMRVLDETGRCIIAAIVRVNRYNQGRGLETTILEETLESTVASAQLDDTVNRLKAKYADSASVCIAAVAEALEAEEADAMSRSRF